jgi:hypothetical protein
MAKFNRTLPHALLGLAAAIALSCSASAATQDFLPSVTALSQKVKGDTVSITYAFLPKDGTLAILSGDPSSRAGASVLGSVALSAGDHRNVKVQLSREPTAGTRLWAAIDQAKSGKPFKRSDERAEQSFKAL